MKMRSVYSVCPFVDMIASLKKEDSDEEVEVALKRAGLTNLNIRVFKCAKILCFLDYM